MDWSGCEFVEQVPGKVGGVPILVRSRMQADGVMENYDDGMTVEEIADEFELEEATVRGVVEYALARRPTHAAA